MAGYRKLWWTLIAVLAITFGVLGYFGTEVYREAPPIPDKFMSTNGNVVATEESVLDGQTAWQSVGGMQLGSIWGHGAYQAPDWTADWLHRELLAWLDIRAHEVFDKPYEQLTGVQQNQLEYELKEEYRTNTYDKASDTVTLSERRIQAIEQTGEYYSKLFSDDPELRPTRVSYAMKENTLPSAERRAVMNDFFFWTAWAAAT
ncbi:MAG: nitric oxide reductase large subunit, partial [Idiomarina sp.]|nr:nitric oxide reductase large subunit [Idiomarina sp.]